MRATREHSLVTLRALASRSRVFYAAQASIKSINCAACGSEITSASASKIANVSSFASASKIASASSNASASKISSASKSRGRVMLINYKLCDQQVQN